MRYLITGATGFIGGHIAEACRKRDWPVSAIVRPGSDCADLVKWGVTLHQADLTGTPADAQVIRQAVLDAEVVVHCAGKVGDWGTLEEFRPANVEFPRMLLDACKGQPLHRFVHMSSLGVYASRHHYGTDETEPLPSRHRDSYSQTKVEAEKLVMSYYRDFGIPVVILRPGFVYGPRDKIVLPRLIENLKAGRVRYPGARGKRALNTIFIGNLLDAVFLAINQDQAVGQIYNLTDGEFVSKRRFIEKIADNLGLPHPYLMPPLWLAWFVTLCVEKYAKVRGATKAPFFNLARIKFLGLNLDFSIEKARKQLGYSPRFEFDDAMLQTLAWYKENHRA